MLIIILPTKAVIKFPIDNGSDNNFEEINDDTLDNIEGGGVGVVPANISLMIPLIISISAFMVEVDDFPNISLMIPLINSLSAFMVDFGLDSSNNFPMIPLINSLSAFMVEVEVDDFLANIS